MTAKEPPSRIEIAHVLFMDLVGYSVLSLAEQAQLLAELQDTVRNTREFRHAEECEGLIGLPAGDGMALVFFHDLVAPVRCAIQISRSLRNHPLIKLRMGIHSGPVYSGEDINGHRNVSGGGVNMAQRAMDCGDAGHILLTNSAAELLRQVGSWPLHDLGDWEAKHGVRLRLFNLFSDEFGNPNVPQWMRRQTSRTTLADETSIVPETSALQVMLLYKRGAQPDELLLSSLERQLVGRGFQIFIDRNLTIGVEWAKELEHRLRTADAVIPLISAAALPSEMFAYELEIAHETAQRHNGKPRILPVRVNYEGPLPEHLSAIIGPLNYALWIAPEDDARLVEELVNALRSPLPDQTLEPPQLLRPFVPLKELEPVGGAVPLDSKFYVVRPADEEFLSAVARRDSIVLVQGPRQIGKTSLLARGLRHARKAEAKVVLTDFQKLTKVYLESAQNLYFALAEAIADQLDLEVLPIKVWNPDHSANMNLERYLRREVLGKTDTPIVWGLDEVDRLFVHSYGTEVFGLFRSWHNERALDPAGPWSRLTLAIAYATEAHLFINDVNQSPFNVGTRVNLDDFTFENVVDLNHRHGYPLRDEAEVARFWRLVGGQPYLVRRGLYGMSNRSLAINELEAQAHREDGLFGDHLRRLLVLLTKSPDLTDAVRAVLQEKPCPTAESFFRLRSAGVMTGDSAQYARLRSRLYAIYLERHLL